MKSFRTVLSAVATLIPLLGIAACNSKGNPPSTFTIGGTVVNLAGSGGGLMLRDNSSDFLQIGTNGTFTFTATVASGGAYLVAVSQQPSNPTQTCGGTGGSGTAHANVTDIQINCAHNEWAWIKGSTMTGMSGIYGTLGVSGATNNPGARQPGATWTDSSGDLWLFGGYGQDSAASVLPLNDLWKFSGGQWTWVGGSNIAGQSGVYGTLGAPAIANIPGARISPVSWKDSSGNFWMFGGNGFDSQGTEADLNDLWEYRNGEWAWMSGSAVAKQKGAYGTKGVAAPDNVPSARDSSVSWIDASGNFLVFGGIGYDSNGKVGELNDLWKYNNGEWTWVSGSNLANQGAVYGALGVPAPNNVPGGRSSAMSWTDSSGNLWLYGGSGYGAGDANGTFGDLWRYHNGQWTWVSGSQVVGLASVYGVKGSPAAANTPGWRQDSATWTDSSGNLGLFGGNGVDLTGQAGALNDLWKYSNGQWTWVSGSNLVTQSGVYGMQGSPAPGNAPGGRLESLTWVDANGSLWLFGGYGSAQSGTQADLDDLWMYTP